MTHFIRTLTVKDLKKKWKCYKQVKVFEFNVDKDFDMASCRRDSTEKLKKEYYYKVFSKYKNKIKNPRTIESAIWKSFLGFLGGVVFTYILFFFFYLGVGFSERITTYICATLGVFLSLGLAFSHKVRCILFLALPIFFLKPGREGLLTFILFLALTGPCKNTMENMQILTHSMTCRQETIRKNLRQILEVVHTPPKFLKEMTQKLRMTLKEVTETVNTFSMNVKRLVFGILEEIEKSTDWLSSIVHLCNKKVGTPFQRCMGAFEESIVDCKAKMGVMEFLCHIVHMVKPLCYTLKDMDFICVATDFGSVAIIEVVKKRTREFCSEIKNLFHVSIKADPPWEPFNSTKKSSKKIMSIIYAENKSITPTSFLFGYFFLSYVIYVIFKVYYYKYKYLSSDEYDNVYISKYIVELDLKRSLMNRETVLPLEPRERVKFAKPTSLRLLRVEKMRMSRSICLLSLTSIKIISFVVLDYSLFWVLMTIYEAGYNELQEVDRPKLNLHVEGEGILADFYRNLGKTFREPDNPEERLNPLHCLPDPNMPDMKRYMQIGFFLLVCWICTLTEAYGLRLRNMVMSEYHPDRARQRAIWLYNHILYSRASFVKYARKHLKRNFQQGNRKTFETFTETKTLDQKFASFFSGVPLLGPYLLKYKPNMCSLCGKLGTQVEPLKCCQSSDCPGKYCLECFVYLRNLCKICQNPIDFGDEFDLSEEVISSEEEMYRRKRCEYLDRLANKKKFNVIRNILGCEELTDLEKIELKDYAKLSDLLSHNETIRKRLKEAIIKRLQTLEAKKEQRERPVKKKLNDRLKSKVQELIKKLKQNKSQLVEKETPQELNKTKPENLEGGIIKKKRKKSSVPITTSTFLDRTKLFSEPKSKADYDKLKNEVKERIKLLKQKKVTTSARGSRSEEATVVENRSVRYEKEARKEKTLKSRAQALRVREEDSKEALVNAESNESLLEFWKESSEIEASRGFGKKKNRVGFVENQVDDSLLEYWKHNESHKSMNFSVHSMQSGRNQSEKDERKEGEDSRLSSHAFNNFTYYYLQKEKNVDIYLMGPKKDVDVRTFKGKEHQDNGNIIL